MNAARVDNPRKSRCVGDLKMIVGFKIDFNVFLVRQKRRNGEHGVCCCHGMDGTG